MTTAGLQDVSKPTTPDSVVSVEALAKLTGFPVDYIKRELLQGDDNVSSLTMEELRQKVFLYLDSCF